MAVVDPAVVRRGTLVLGAGPVAVAAGAHDRGRGRVSETAP